MRARHHFDLTQIKLDWQQRCLSKHCTFWGRVFWLSLSFALVHSLHWFLVPAHLLRAPVSIFLCDQKQNETDFSYVNSSRLFTTNFELITQKAKQVHFRYYATRDLFWLCLNFGCVFSWTMLIPFPISSLVAKITESGN